MDTKVALNFRFLSPIFRDLPDYLYATLHTAVLRSYYASLKKSWKRQDLNHLPPEFIQTNKPQDHGILLSL